MWLSQNEDYDKWNASGTEMNKKRKKNRKIEINYVLCIFWQSSTENMCAVLSELKLNTRWDRGRLKFNALNKYISIFHFFYDRATIYKKKSPGRKETAKFNGGFMNIIFSVVDNKFYVNSTS